MSMKPRFLSLGGALALTLVCAFAAASPDTGESQDAARRDLSGVKSWAAQLQDTNIDELVASPFDLLVIDYSWDGTDAGAHTFAEIQRIRDAGKIVLAYLPIGELGNYRFYWQEDWTLGDPSYLGPPNPMWPGDFIALYWEEGFLEQVVLPSLERILAAGFDGVWLDNSDSHWFWSEHGYDLTQSADRMARLLHEVAGIARAEAGEDYIVCANNGLSLLEHTSSEWREQYLTDIDGVTAEDILFGSEDREDLANSIRMLEMYAAAGKKLLSLEYVERESYDEYLESCADLGFEILPYAGHPDLELDELILSAEQLRSDVGGKLRVRGKLPFGRVRVGDQATRTLKIRNRGELPLAVRVFGSADVPFTLIGGVVTAEIPARSALEVQVRFDPDLPGKARGEITIRSSDAAKPVVTVRLKGRGK